MSLEYTRKDFIAKHLVLLENNVADHPDLADSIVVWLDLWTRTPQVNNSHAIKVRFPPELRQRMQAHRAKHSAFGPDFLDGYRRELHAVFEYMVSPNPAIDYLYDIGSEIKITQEEFAYWVKLGNADAKAAGILWRIGPSLLDAMQGLLRQTEIPNFRKWDGDGQPPAVRSAGRGLSDTTKLCIKLIDAGCADFKSACEYMDANGLPYPPIEPDSFRTAFNRAIKK